MEPLKNMFNPVFLEQVGDAAEMVLEDFDKKVFLKAVFAGNWEQLELKQRIRRISTVLHDMFSGDYTHDIHSLLALTEELHRRAGRDNTFEYMFLPDYIEQYGTLHPRESLKAMERITILVSCEYAIRPFLIQDLKGTLAVMKKWTGHKHASVRRLATEGCRPRLPWGMALPELKKDPAPIMPILDLLKQDESEFVRRSVANNLNDIAKDNPHVVLEIAKQWQGISEDTDRLIKHASRTLLKRADAAALSLFGISQDVNCAISGLSLASERLQIGEYLEFSFLLENRDKATADFRVEYAIHYCKAGGKTGRKVFKITENRYAPGKPVSFSRRQSFADMTTRKHYAGLHTLEIVINGKPQATVTFDVYR